MNHPSPHQNSDNAFELMSSPLSDVTVEMYADYEIAVMPSPVVVPLTNQDIGAEVMGIAVLGYVGEGVRGALTLIALQTTIQGWLSRMGMEGGEPADALGEFSNMLLGRLKSRLLTEGIPIQLATPTIAVGRGLHLSPAHAHSTSLGFESSSGHLRLRLDANFDAEFAFEKPTHADAPAEAGDAFIF